MERGERGTLPGRAGVSRQRAASTEDRTWGQARAQHEIVHRHGWYDCEVDTSLYSPEECAQQIIHHVGGGAKPWALRRIREQLSAPGRQA